VLTTTSAGGGYYEYFMGDEGSIKMSENPRVTKVYREDRAPEWDRFVTYKFIQKAWAPPKKDDGKIDVRETAPLVAYDIPVELNKPIHQPHLENFFDAIRGEAKLNSDGEHSFISEASIFAVNPTVEARKTYEFKSEDFVV
jgi:truncated hemoglobin YjbI